MYTNKRRKQAGMVLAAIMAAATLMTGCAEESSQDDTIVITSEETAVTSGTEEAAETLSGRVVSVTESVLTIESGDAPEGMQGGTSGGSDSAGTDGTQSGNGEAPSGAPDGQSRNGNAPQGEAPSGAPDGQPGNGGAPQGEAPSGAPDGQSGNGGAPQGEAPSGAPGGQSGNGGAPQGEAPSGAPDGQPGNGEAPQGEAPSGAPVGNGAPEGMQEETTEIPLTESTVFTDADGNSITYADLEEGSRVVVTLDEDGNALTVTVDNSVPEGAGGAPGGMGMSASSVSYTAVTEITSDTTISGESYTSTGTDENAIYAYDGAKATLKDITITRESSDSTGGDNSSFYGVGAALLVSDATVDVSGATITTDAAGGAGAFAYGDGVLTISDSTILTKKGTSGGIHVAGGGTLYANNLTVETNGESSAAIRSDRGGGTMVVKEGSYTSNGTGSPAVYCTADITVSDAELTATGSEAVCIEGLNTLTLENCDLTGNMSDDSRNECTWNVIVYQSMSGDSEVGNGTFSMTGGHLTAGNGGMFYTTNTECTFYLSDVDITYAQDKDFFLRCTGNTNQRGWGTTGKNGSQCTFTADNQAMEGDIIYDSISTLDFYMTNGSVLTGAVVDDESCAGNGGDGYCRICIDKNSKWVVTGDSVLTTLENEGSIVDASGKTVTIQGTDGTVYVKGSSSYTVTVENYAETIG